jgi:type I restriction-modification system DNA methylase subunit
MNTDEFTKEFATIRSKAIKYDGMSKRYVEIAAKLKKIGEQLNEISKEIDPFLNIKKAEEGMPAIKGSFMDIGKELYEKLITGTEISRKFIETVYPGYTNEQYGYLLQMIGKMPNVSKRREGMFIYLYAKKDSFRGKDV